MPEANLKISGDLSGLFTSLEQAKVKLLEVTADALNVSKTITEVFKASTDAIENQNNKIKEFISSEKQLYAAKIQIINAIKAEEEALKELERIQKTASDPKQQRELKNEIDQTKAKIEALKNAEQGQIGVLDQLIAKEKDLVNQRNSSKNPESTAQINKEIAKTQEELISKEKQLYATKLETINAIKAEETVLKELERIQKTASDPKQQRELKSEIEQTKVRIQALKNAEESQIGIIEKLIAREKELVNLRNNSQNVESIKRINKEIESTRTQINKLSGDTQTGFGRIKETVLGVGAAIGISFGVQALSNFAKESVEIALKAEGIERAFGKLNSPQLLDNLRQATRGTISDLELMRGAVVANNFQIPLEKLGSLFQFASVRARETGESVDYLTNSIVTGIARKSPLILDNLGINVKRVQEEFKKTGDFAQAAFKIVNEEIAAQGIYIETDADKVDQLAASFQNFKLLAGQTLLALKQGFTGFAQGIADIYLSVTQGTAATFRFAREQQSKRESEAIQSESRISGVVNNLSKLSIADQKKNLDILRQQFADFIRERKEIAAKGGNITIYTRQVIETAKTIRRVEDNIYKAESKNIDQNSITALEGFRDAASDKAKKLDVGSSAFKEAQAEAKKYQDLIDAALGKTQKGAQGAVNKLEHLRDELKRLNEELVQRASKATADNLQGEDKINANLQIQLKEVDVFEQKLLDARLKARKAGAKIEQALSKEQQDQLALLRTSLEEKAAKEINELREKLALEENQLKISALRDGEQKELAELNLQSEERKKNLIKNGQSEAQVNYLVNLQTQEKALSIQRRYADERQKLEYEIQHNLLEIQKAGAVTNREQLEAQSQEIALQIQEARDQLEKLRGDKEDLDSKPNVSENERLKIDADISKEEAKIAKLGQEFKKLNDEIKKTNFSLDDFIKNIFGLSSQAEIDAVKDAFGSLFKNVSDLYTESINQQLEDTRKLKEEKQSALQEAEKELDRELDLNKQGFASNVEGKRKEVAELKKQRDAAARQEAEAAEKQRQIQTAMQIGSLVTASANIFEATAPLNVVPGLGTIVALGIIGTMFALFAQAQQRASSAAQGSKRLAKGGKLEGPSHEQGGIPGTGRFADTEAEGGEWIINKAASAEHDELLRKINAFEDVEPSDLAGLPGAQKAARAIFDEMKDPQEGRYIPLYERGFGLESIKMHQENKAQEVYNQMAVVSELRALREDQKQLK